MSSKDNTANNTTAPLLLRLWRGEVPLATAYWAYWVFVDFLLILAMKQVERLSGEDSIAIKGFAILFFLYQIFICISIWRASHKYEGPKQFSSFARLSIVICVAIFSMPILITLFVK